jgi:predicted dehydrogenase
VQTTRFALFGAGFWARYQLAGWLELPGVSCSAICDLTQSKADELAHRFGVPASYDDPERLLDEAPVDFVDICTPVETHADLVLLAARRKLPVVCQKPMARSWTEAERMVEACREAGVLFLANENWRWQAPIRALKRVLDEGAIGQVFRARISMVSGFPVFVNQPFLRELEHFVLMDMGSHLLDTARFLFGEAATLYCQTQRVHTDIRGEDVATVMLRTQDGATVSIEMGYAENYLERECFPQTLIFVEGTKGSAELAPDYWVRVTTASGTHARRVPPPRYCWADPAYEVVQSSIVPCQANLLAALRGEAQAETTGEDNLRTMRLVFAAYESAAEGKVIRL